VVTLFLALAALATMGFSAKEDSRATSILPDEATCALSPASYSALELLALVDEPCYAAMIDEVEHEVSKGVAASASTTALIDGILERSRAAGPWSDELLEPSYAGQASLAPRSASFSDWGLSEADLAKIELGQGWASLAPRSRSFSDWGLTETDLAEIELDRGWNSATDVQSLINGILERSRAAGPWSDELLEPSYAGQARLAPRSPSFTDWGLTETDLAEIELDRGWNSATDVQSLIDSIYGKIQSGSVSYDEFSEDR
jgi:hypothetical protein